MSGRLVGEILRCAPEDLTDAELKVLIVLAENARDHDRTARIPAKTIAYLARAAPGTVKNALSSLAARALIQPLRRAQKYRSQDYRLTPLSEHHRASQRHPGVTQRDNSQGHSAMTLWPVDNEE